MTGTSTKIVRMHVYMSEYNYLLYQIMKEIIRQLDIQKSSSQTFKNIKSEEKCQVQTNMNQFRINTNFTMKHNPQTYLDNDNYNNLKPKMWMFKP